MMSRFKPCCMPPMDAESQSSRVLLALESPHHWPRSELPIALPGIVYSGWLHQAAAAELQKAPVFANHPCTAHEAGER